MVLDREIKIKVYERADYKCEFCGKKAEEIHHSMYVPNDFDIKEFEHLIAVCNKCHGLCHGIRDNESEECSKTKDFLDISVEKPLDVEVKFVDSRGEIMCRGKIQRVNEKDLFSVLKKYIFYCPFDNQSGKLFEEKLRKELSEKGALLNPLEFWSDNQVPINDIKIETKKESMLGKRLNKHKGTESS